MMYQKQRNPLEILWGPNNNDNLHLIAISNLDDPKRRMERWWSKKYKTAPKQLEDYTHEELLIEMLEDYYDNNTTEVDRFLAGLDDPSNEWDGSMPADYEKAVKSKLKNFFARNAVDLSKYKSDKKLTPDEEQALLDNLGRRLPKSRVVKQSSPKEKDEYALLGGDLGEFEEEF